MKDSVEKSTDSDEYCFDAGRLYDTLIVGAGLAGLSTAYELKETNLLVIEKNDYLGGRVCTGNENGIVYELGSLFAYRKDVLPFEINTSPLIREDGQIGLYHHGAMFYGQSGLECLLQTGVTMQQLEQIFRTNTAAAPSNMIPTLLNALFRVIHPGNMTDAVPQRWQDALIKFETHHFEQGNQELIMTLTKELSSEIVLKTEVLAIEEDSDCVKTTFRQRDQLMTVCSKTVVVSTPAPVTKNIVTHLHQHCRNFLNALRYGEGTVVIIGCQDMAFHDFSYIVTPQLPLNTIFKYHTRDEHITVLAAYYVAEQSAALQRKEEQDIISQVRDILDQIHPYTGSMTQHNILFSKIYRWEHIGPVISSEAYRKWTPECCRPSERVFLCGDYQYVNHDNLMPYGMTAAILSGRQTAKAVKAFLFE